MRYVKKKVVRIADERNENDHSGQLQIIYNKKEHRPEVTIKHI